MPSWAPTPDQVAALLRARTQAAASISAPAGEEAGRFTASTRPTLDQVRELIGMACAEVGALFAGRSPCSSELEAAAGVAAAYRTAMQVEASYHPESTGEGSLFAALRDMWDRSSAAVAEAINARCPFDDGSDGDGGTLAPTGRTPNRVLIGPSRVRW